MPNCHSLTPTWRRRKKGPIYENGLARPKNEIIEAIKSSKNVSQCLKKLKLGSGCYGTIYKIMNEENIDFGI